MRAKLNVVDLRTALGAVRSDRRIFVQGGAATPAVLLEELVAQRERLRNVELVHLHTMGPATYAHAEHADHFRVTNLFVGPNLRSRMGAPNVDYLPCFLSEIPALFRGGTLPIDVALVQVSPPDAHGYCSLGLSVDVALAAVQTARVVIAQVNPRMPRVHGDGIIPVSQIHFAVEHESEMPEDLPPPATPEEKRIGEAIASLIDDGATLQIGIGAVPNAALQHLKDRRHLGVHSELWSDGTLELIEAGAVDNSHKRILRGKTVSSFLTGSRRLYDFVHDNPSVVQLEASFVNDSNVIASNPKVVSINSAVEIDLTGQVCADSVGSRIISGVGGQMDFVRGATLSEGGKAIIALTSRTRKGHPRIVPTLHGGAGVVTTRAHVHYVITEYGVADLWGKTVRQRARALTAIAHPDDRATLEDQWHALGF